MTNRYNMPRLYKVTDPNREPVHIIDQATFHGCHGSLIDLTLCTMTLMPDGRTNFIAEAVVASRLRFDVSMAKALIEGLSKQVAMVEGEKTGEDLQSRDKLHSVVN